MSFALTSTTTLVIDYFVQLSVIQPSLSMLCMAPVIVGNTKVEKAIRWLYVAYFTLNAISFGLYAVFYGIHREYRFELTTISINWLTLITTGVLLSIMFRRALAALSDNRKVEVSPQAA